VFWVLSVYFNIRNTLPKSGTFLLGHSVYEKNSRVHFDSLQNKYINFKGVKINTNFGQITGIQEKLDTACKYSYNGS